MKKSYSLLLFVILCIVGKTNAQLLQPCSHDEAEKRMIAQHPELAQAKADYDKQIDAALKKIDFSKVARTTGVDESGNPTFWYDIPVVVHIIHDYNESSSGEYLSDNFIFNALNDWNIVYAKKNADTADVIAPFKKWIGNPRLRLHLASIDPNGNPTHGITRHRSYLTYNGGDQAKFDDWQPTSYVNIWSINQMSVANGMAAAYAYFPSTGAAFPPADGIIALSSYIDAGGASSIGTGSSFKTINHEMGHVFSLYHPWGSTNNPGVACGDDDVDDTPPTEGHVEPGCQYSLPSSNPNSTYDSACARNYFKIYTSSTGIDSLVNYPDTTNAQNIMDYTYCAKMFTIGQVARMHAALNSNVGGRNNLWDTANLVATGVMDINHNFISRVDLKPIPEFAVTRITNGGEPTALSYMNTVNYFMFPHIPAKFHNETWNDTLTSLTWEFSNGASTPISTSQGVFTNSFSQPGWVDLKMIPTGNNSGTDTVDWPQAVFVADSTGTPASGYFQEWEPNGDYAKWPYFNYYGNEFHWQLDSTVGFDDHYCMKYTGFDNRIILDYTTGIFVFPNTGSPFGDFDDLFSVPMDLSAFSDSCNLNFWYAAASRSTNSADINDTLEIDYTTRSDLNSSTGITWHTLTILSKGSLINNGAYITEFVPASALNWSPQTISLPAAARTSYTTFRFRYWPHTGSDATYSSGNDFYLDRLNFSRTPAVVNTVALSNLDVAVVPNPTNGDAYVVIKDADNVKADIIVTDIAGKEVFRTSQQLAGGEAHIVIPHAAIAVSGMYMVQTITGNQSQTKKLVVY